MPPEQSARMESVPVGAMEVTVALRVRSPRASAREPAKFGNTPRSSASAAEAASARAVDAAHHLLGDADGLGRVVRNPEIDEQVGEAHDAEPDLAIGARHGADLRIRVVTHLDHVVEEAHARASTAASSRDQSIRPSSTKASRRSEPRLQASQGSSGSSPQGLVAVERTELAASGSRGSPHRGRSRPDRRSPTPSVRSIAEQAAGIDAAPSPGRSRGFTSGHAVPLSTARQKSSGVVTERLKLVQLVGSSLAAMKARDVGVIDAQHTHVRAAAATALLHDRRGRVEDPQEGRRDPRRCRESPARRRRPAAAARSRSPCRRRTGG